jgi:uncharacterized membrane protein
MSQEFFIAGAQFSIVASLIVLIAIYVVATLSMLAWLAVRTVKGIYDFSRVAIQTFRFSYTSRTLHN